jgi:hypothetical protein
VENKKSPADTKQFASSLSPVQTTVERSGKQYLSTVQGYSLLGIYGDISSRAVHSFLAADET